jgi:hypothetical protein
MFFKKNVIKFHYRLFKTHMSLWDVNTRDTHVTITNVHCYYEHRHTQGSSAYLMHTDLNSCTGGDIVSSSWQASDHVALKGTVLRAEW